jgi:hypothetical protein
LERWQERLQVPTADFVNPLAAADRLGVIPKRVTIWLYTERIKRAYLNTGEAGVNRASLEEFAAWREGAGLLQKFRHALGTLVRLI